MIGVFLVAAITALILIPRILFTIAQINAATYQVETAIDTVTYQVETATEGINLMTAELTETSTNVNKLLGENSDAMAEAVKKLSEIDYEGLNKAINDLQDAVGPLASFLGRFR